MEQRALGASGLQVQPVMFGAWAIGGWFWGETDDDLATEALHASHDAGITWVDTAPIYGFGHSERVIGRALRGRDVRIATKCGLRWDDARGEAFFQTRAARLGPVDVKRNLRPESVRLECERSLERLGVETIDLYQCHWPDPSTPIAETMGELVRLRDEGKIRAIGVSNFSVEQLEETRRALGAVPLASHQPHYSALDRSIEAEVLPWSRAAGIATLAYSPLARGLLTGKVGLDRVFPAGDRRGELPGFSQASRARVLAMLAEVEPIRAVKQCTFAQLAIAWTVAQPGLTTAIVGARNARQAAENAEALSVSLSREERLELSRAWGL